jgi:hypothetical protein
MIRSNVTSLDGTRQALQAVGRWMESHERWRFIDAEAYTHSPVSTSTFTVKDDSLDTWSTGVPVRYMLGRSDDLYYGILNNTTPGNDLVAVRGVALSDSIRALWVGLPEMVHEVRLYVPGAYSGAAQNTLMYAVAKHAEYWAKSPMRLVEMLYYHKGNDTGAAQPVINANLNGTRAFLAGLTVSSAYQATSVGIDPANCRITGNQYLDVDCVTQGTNGDAADLTCNLVFVSEQ